MSYLMCCTTWLKSLSNLNPFPRSLLHPRMNDRHKWMGSQLPHQRWCRGRGAQSRRSAPQWRLHNTRHQRTTFSLVKLLQFYRSLPSTSGTSFVHCVAVGDCLQPRSAHHTEIVEDALSGMQNSRSPLLPHPPGLEPRPLGPARQSESDPSERCLFRKPLRYSIDKSVASRSADDGVPVPPSRFSKIHDGVSPSPNPQGWVENLIEEWPTLVNRGVLGPLHLSEAATAHMNRQRDFFFFCR